MQNLDICCGCGAMGEGGWEPEYSQKVEPNMFASGLR